MTVIFRRNKRRRLIAYLNAEINNPKSSSKHSKTLVALFTRYLGKWSTSCPRSPHKKGSEYSDIMTYNGTKIKSGTWRYRTMGLTSGSLFSDSSLSYWSHAPASSTNKLAFVINSSRPLKRKWKTKWHTLNTFYWGKVKDQREDMGAKDKIIPHSIILSSICTLWSHISSSFIGLFLLPL